MPEQRKIYVMNGTHWDREWYYPFQWFRFSLAATLDSVLEIMRRDKDFRFVFDGQTIVLEDYYEIRPEKRAEVEERVKEGRLRIGPWYVMPDENLVSGESLVENLLRGRRICFDHGVEPMKDGYVVDCFGHTAQMAQIFSGFGLVHATLGRGANRLNTPAHFIWRAPDGTSLPAFKLSDRDGYGILTMLAWYMPDDEAEVERRLREMVDSEFERSDVPIVFLVDAHDHRRPNEIDKNVIVPTLKKLYPDAEVGFLDPDELPDLVEKEGEELPVRTGELLDTGITDEPYFHVIANVLSSRPDLKRRNDQVQTILEKWASPLQAIDREMASVKAGPCSDTKPFLDVAWKYLIQNQPHDSICGCSIDEVHRGMHFRFDQADQIARRFKEFTVDSASWDSVVRERGELAVAVWNPLPYKVRRVVTVNITFDKDFPTWGEPFGYEKLNKFEIRDKNGREIPYNILSQKMESVDGNVATVAFEADLAPLGATAYSVVKSDKAATRYFDRLTKSPVTADNGIVALEIAPDGSIKLTDHSTGEVYPDLLTFYDDADAGDGWYNVTPAANRRILSNGAPTQIDVVTDGPALCTFRITKTMTVPRELSRGDGRMTSFTRSRDSVEMKIVSDVTLCAGENRVHVKTTVFNNAMDHRLRVRFPTGVSPESDYVAEVPFCFVTRRSGCDKKTEHWMEADRGDKPTSGIVIRREGDRGLAVCSHYGIHECVSADDADASLNLTLFRAFRQTVITDFSPEAEGQVQGKQEYEFDVMPITDRTSLTEIKRTFDSDVAGVSSSMKWGEPKDGASFLEVTGGAVYSTMKATESGDGVVVRLFALDEDAVTTLTFPKPISRAALCDLKEDETETLSADGCSVTLKSSPWRITTVKVRF
ncbi:MAG: hypothetical protein IJT70_01950 [Clostridia bacterium]|nr:hypothetical protein [Clostridia bacterium]